MAATYRPVFMTGWESGAPNEWGYDTSASLQPGWAAVAVPSAPAGIAMGSYCVQLTDATSDVRDLNGVDSDTTGLALGFMWRPKTNPSSSTLGQQIIGVDDQALNGFSLVWDDTNYKLNICDSLGVTANVTSTTVFDATSPSWYWISIVVHKVNPVIVRIYNTSRSLVETLIDTVNYPNATNHRIRIGQVAGTATGAFYIDNFYMLGTPQDVPIAPNFKSDGPNAIQQDTGTVDGTPTTTTLDDSTKSWTDDQWIGYQAVARVLNQTAVATSTTTIDGTFTNNLYANDWVKINGEWREITSNNTTRLTLRTALNADPSDTATFEIFNARTITDNDSNTLTFAAMDAAPEAATYYIHTANRPEWRLENTNVDDPVNEHTYINEIPPTDTTSSYLEREMLTTAIVTQSYEHDSGMITSENILAVGVIARLAQNGSPVQQVAMVDPTTSASLASASIAIGDGDSTATNDVWGYKRMVVSNKDPNGNDWTASVLDRIWLSHRSTNISTGKMRISQLILYVAYGTDNVPTPAAAAFGAPLLMMGIG